MEIHKYNLHVFCTRYNLTEHELFNIEAQLSDNDWWIAGGAVRSLLTNQPITTDVDFFFKNQEAYDRFKEQAQTLNSYTVVADTEHCLTFMAWIDEKKYKIQAIKIDFYDDVAECLDTFDFTICQLAIQGGQLYAAPYTLWDLARRRLVIHKITYGVASVRRLLKYGQQGFKACSGCLQQLLEEIADQPELIQSNVEYVD